MISKEERQKLLKLYTKGPAAYGSVSNLQKASKFPREKVERFLETINAHSKYGLFKKRFPRLSVIAYDINEIWSRDLAYMDN